MNKYIESFIRHGLGAFGAWLAAKSVPVDSNLLDTIASGAVQAAVGTVGVVTAIGWSIWEKKVRARF